MWKLTNPCAGPNCDNQAEVGELCRAHYAQQRRSGTLKPLRSGDQTEQVTFRCPKALKRKAEQAAASEGLDPAEWWRQAGAAALLSYRKR